MSSAHSTYVPFLYFDSSEDKKESNACTMNDTSPTMMQMQFIYESAMVPLMKKRETLKSRMFEEHSIPHFRNGWHSRGAFLPVIDDLRVHCHPRGCYMIIRRLFIGGGT